MDQRERRRDLTMLLLACTLGAALAPLFGLGPARAQGTDQAPACPQWEVATFAPNTDDTQPELLPLGMPRPFAPELAFPYPRDEDEARVLLPGGWEPIGFGAAVGQLGEAVVLARRCAS